MHLTVHAVQSRRDKEDKVLALWNYLSNLGATVRRREIGATMVEYGLLVALIAVVVIAALLVLGPAIAGLFNNVADSL
jgi:pilus assembly protein Flp/PilA